MTAIKVYFPVLSILSLLILEFGVSASGLEKGKTYMPILQPKFDTLNVVSYFRNEALIRLQVRCLFYGGPCDVVGRWAKPRIITGILGKCLNCSQVQSKWIEQTIEAVSTKFPNLYRPLLGRFLEYMDIKIPAEERVLVARAFEMTNGIGK